MKLMLALALASMVKEGVVVAKGMAKEVEGSCFVKSKESEMVEERVKCGRQ